MNLTGWSLTRASAISADGSTIVGYGQNGFGQPEAWRVTLPIAAPCPDLGGDGIVNAADLAVLLGAWGPCPGCPADLNGDGIVNAADLAILLGNWGPCP